MSSLPIWILAALVLAGLLAFLSVVEICVIRLSRVTLKVLFETTEHSSSRHLLGEIARDRSHFLLPLQLGILIIHTGITVLVTILMLVHFPFWNAVSFSLLVAIPTAMVFRHLIPRLIVHHHPERILLRVLAFFTPLYRLLQWTSLPLSSLLTLFQNSRHSMEPLQDQDEEATEEEIQAYLGVGEEEGIFEQEESELIQSALEFGSTLVREIMTPRTEIVSIGEEATLSQLKDVIVTSKHSRIPVYRERIDQVVGIVYVRNLLAVLEEGKGDAPITPLLSPPFFVPETKRVSELLKEMQSKAENIAIVINEYGAVSGLVSIEDLVEEIVGEIRDEDEMQRIDLSYEGEGSYVVRGGVAIEELEQVLGVDLGEPDVTTVSGLVVSHLGRVPVAGENLVLNGLSIEVLSSDRKRIHTLRVRMQTPESEPGNPPVSDSTGQIVEEETSGKGA